MKKRVVPPTGSTTRAVIAYSVAKPLVQQRLGRNAQIRIQLLRVRLVAGVGVDIQLDFRLRAGRAHADPVALLQLEVQHVGFRQTCRFDLSVRSARALQIVANRRDLHAAEFLRGILTQVLHDFLHAGQAVFARQRLADDLFHEIAVFAEDGLHIIIERDALRGAGTSDLGNQQGGVHAILVAHERAGQEAVAFLEAEEERVRAGVLKLLNLLADKLEARQRLEHLHAEGSGNFVRQRRGHDGLHRRAVLGECPLPLLGGEDVVQQHAADLVAGQQLPVAIAGLDGDAQTVAVGVSGENDLRADFIRQLDGKDERAGVFGVRHLDGGEVRVRQLLLLDDGDVADADFAQDAANRHVARGWACRRWRACCLPRRAVPAGCTAS